MNRRIRCGLVVLSLLASFKATAGEDDELLFMFVGTTKNVMQMARAETKGKAGVGALFGAASFYVSFPDSGPASPLRTTTKRPVFGRFDAPMSVRVEEVVKLVRLDVDDKSRVRQVQVAKSRLGAVERGFAPASVVPVAFKKVGEGISEGKRANQYRMTPEADLVPGEYAVLVGNSFWFDFGVDP